MFEEIIDDNNYFVSGTTTEIKKAEEEKQNIEKSLEREIDKSLEMDQDVYKREISYCRVVGYVKEQD